MDKNKRERVRYLLNDEVNKAIEDEALDFNFDLIESEVLSYCNRMDFPPGLMLIVIKMVAEYTMANYYKSKMAEEAAKGNENSERTVSSVTRGDTTISYGDKAKVYDFGSPMKAYLAVNDFVGNYTDQIRKYRRLKTPW